jgi:AraC-like DNA-binding protein
VPVIRTKLSIPPALSDEAECTFYLQKGFRSSSEMRQSHFHDIYEIYYLVSGERNYLIGDRTYRISTGDLVFISPYELHRATNTSVPYNDSIVINFSKTFLGDDRVWIEDELSPFASGRHVLSLPLPVRTRVEEIFRTMELEYRERNIAFEGVIRAALAELLIVGIRHNRAASDKTNEYDDPHHQKISEIVRFINDNYGRPITLDALSARFYISPYHLSRLFKKMTGFTYVEYVATVRIYAAQKLLRETKWKVQRIMEHVGFQNLAHFGKVFKKTSGCTPLQYRKGSGV